MGDATLNVNVQVYKNGIVTLLFCASLKKCIFIHFLGSNCFNFEIILQTFILF